jgi:Trk K+ transport system NAD-binding subunit
MVRPLLLQRMQRRFAKPLAVLLVLRVIGAAAYRIIGGDQYALFAGVFAVVGDDSRNLVITLSAKSLNPKVRVVARCHDIAWVDKMKRVGADAIVSPDFTGGMRIAAAMIRPAVVTFRDEMLRSDKALRVEEVRVAERHAGQTLGMIALLILP